MKKLQKFDMYDDTILINGWDRNAFVHQYFPTIISKVLPNIVFTTIGVDMIEWPEDVEFPSTTQITSETSKIIHAWEADKGIFERCYENGVLTKDAYYISSPEAKLLINELPVFFNLSGAFSISEASANLVYKEAYLSVYFIGSYQNTDSVSFSYKISKTTKSILDIKLISKTVPTQYLTFLPNNTAEKLFGAFISNSDFVEVFFSFTDELLYKEYLGTNYIPPQEYSTLGRGMIGLTIDSTNSVVRTKRYFFGEV